MIRRRSAPLPSEASDGCPQEGEHRLVESLEAALDRISEAVVVCDADGREVYRNRRATHLVPTRLDAALVGQTIDACLAEARDGISSESAIDLYAPRRTLVVRSFGLAGRDGPLGAAAIVEDASERQRIDAIRRDFVANVSHELKTPVGALSLLAETLQDEDDPEVISRLSQRVGAEAERLERIIDDLLDLSRIEVDEGEDRETVLVADLLAEVLDPLWALAAARDIDLRLDPVEPRLAITCNRRDVVSAISNLVDNAVKYSERGGLVHVAARQDGAQLVISVTDRGIGIPARDTERIFERFYRVDRARSRSTGGTGLGLSIVRHVAANHGGWISLESQEGVGSTFTLCLALNGGRVGKPEEEPVDA